MPWEETHKGSKAASPVWKKVEVNPDLRSMPI